MSSPAVSAAPAWANRIVGSGEEAPDQLLANPSNWRTHPKAQREALREVLDTVGYVAQVIVNRRTGHLVDGHLRVEEALSHGQPSIPVLYVDLSPEEEALVLASLDPLAAMATTDEAKLRELLAEVSVDSEALAAMLAALAPAEPKDGLVDPDEVPEPPDEPVTKPGDLWLLGDHRLLCGDAGSEADLDRLLDGATVDLLLTDPPYNVKVEPRSNNAIAAGMAASYDASYQEALESSKRRRTVKALDAQGRHHSGFDVARGKSGVRHHQKLDLGWHDIHITHRQRRKRRRLRSAEYALGYAHGRIDDAGWPEYPEWWPDFAQAPRVAHDPASPARFEASDAPGAAGRAGVVSGALRWPTKASREAVA